jgi:preprotein translocase subunit SecE
MNAKLEKSESSVADYGKLGLAGLIVVASIVAFYWFGDVSTSVRGVGLLLALVAALAIAAFTGPGRTARHFLSESNFELRKVVWPTRQETIQTTLVIMVVVLILSLLLWLIDLSLGAVILGWLLKSH